MTPQLPLREICQWAAAHGYGSGHRLHIRIDDVDSGHELIRQLIVPEMVTATPLDTSEFNPSALQIIILRVIVHASSSEKDGGWVFLQLAWMLSPKFLKPILPRLRRRCWRFCVRRPMRSFG